MIFTDVQDASINPPDGHAVGYAGFTNDLFARRAAPGESQNRDICLFASQITFVSESFCGLEVFD